jgi:hypothetical protein
MNDRATPFAALAVPAAFRTEDAFGFAEDDPATGYQTGEEMDWRTRLVTFGAAEQTRFQVDGAARARAWAERRRRQRDSRRQAERSTRALSKKA